MTDQIYIQPRLPFPDDVALGDLTDESGRSIASDYDIPRIMLRGRITSITYTPYRPANIYSYNPYLAVLRGARRLNTRLDSLAATSDAQRTLLATDTGSRLVRRILQMEHDLGARLQRIGSQLTELRRRVGGESNDDV